MVAGKADQLSDADFVVDSVLENGVDHLMDLLFVEVVGVVI